VDLWALEMPLFLAAARETARPALAVALRFHDLCILDLVPLAGQEAFRAEWQLGQAAEELAALSQAGVRLLYVLPD